MNNNFLFYGTAWWPIYKKKEKRAKYFFEIYISLSGKFLRNRRVRYVSLTRIDTESRPIIIAILFPERLYTQFLFTYLEHGQRGGSPSFPSPENRNARTPSINCTFAQPIFNLSRADQIRTISRFVSQFFRTTDESVSFSFFLFLFLLLQISVVPLLFAF